MVVMVAGAQAKRRLRQLISTCPITESPLIACEAGSAKWSQATRNWSQVPEPSSDTQASSASWAACCTSGLGTGWSLLILKREGHKPTPALLRSRCAAVNDRGRREPLGEVQHFVSRGHVTGTDCDHSRVRAR